MNAQQHERPREFIDRIGRGPIDRRWIERHNGYNLFKHGADRRFGFVRFNVAGSNARNFAVYATCYDVSDDPEGRFSPNAAPTQHLAIVNPNDDAEIRYALSVLRASYDRAYQFREAPVGVTVDMIVNIEELRDLDDTIENLIDRMSAWKGEVEQAYEAAGRIEVIRTNVEHICAAIDTDDSDNAE